MLFVNIKCVRDRCTRYVGDFAGGLQDGQGKLTSPDGASYDGDWQKGKKVSVEEFSDVYGTPTSY